MNIRNYGVVEGRLTKDPVVFNNTDGSKKVMLTIAAQDNFKNKDGVRGTQFVPVEGFITNKQAGLGVYEYLHKGDLVGIEYTVRSNAYTDKKTNEKVYATVMLVQSVDLKESKASVERRQNAAAPAAGEAAPTPADTVADKEEAPFS